jgi:hypothetical protein
MKNKDKTEELINCIQCGKEFKSNRPNAKYCSRSCASEACHLKWMLHKQDDGE